MPYASATLMQVHPPKTGGTWAQHVFRRLHPDTWLVARPHTSVRDHRVRDVVRSRETFATIRNPWDWYCSHWLHARLATLRYGERPPAFREYLRQMTHPTGMLPAHPGLFFRMDPWVREWMVGEQIGLASAVARWFVASDPRAPGSGVAVSWLVDTDGLEAGLAVVLGVGRSDVAGYAPQNERRHYAPKIGMPDRYADWYDDEMRQWVADADGWLITLGGYDPHAPAVSPVIGGGRHGV